MYKVGDEVIVKGTIKDINFNYDYPFKVRFADFENAYFSEKELTLADKMADKNYKQGLADAWELLRKVYDMTCNTIEEIFGVEGGFWNIIRDFTYEEALTKIEAYEGESAIVLGDEVEHDCNSFRTTFFVTYLNENQIKGLDKTGNTHYFTMPNQYIKKTGKHIDIEGLLKQIGE